ncbi:Putative lysophospholipase [Musa troglodytarum]|uniref:Lysophospholipase n=1 Tax=Musa troglodytarum TaxID=320322 RepID=A0A9E7L4W3_9LILI|nr:Putative lysophospholipase [Musa troglodytarum]
MIHGYGNDISWTFQATPIFLAQHGFACFALDLPGHGRSQGLRAFVSDVDAVACDCLAYFRSVRQSPELQGLPCFLFGESMGGALCLLIHLLEQEGEQRWDGAVLVAPIPLRYAGRPRLGTVAELMRVTDRLNSRLSEVTIPFIVLHGSADVVTDPSVSRALYDAAKSKDKTIKIYDGMLHSLLFGEPDENVAMVRNDILAWLNERTGGAADRRNC